MADRAARAAERDLEPGGEERRIALRLRENTLTMSMVELMAYCGNEAARSFGVVRYEHIPGLVCCCGSYIDDYEHGAGGVEYYTHPFVHACEHYDTECECDQTVVWHSRNKFIKPPSKFRDWVDILIRKWPLTANPVAEVTGVPPSPDTWAAALKMECMRSELEQACMQWAFRLPVHAQAAEAGEQPRPVRAEK